MTGTHVFLTQDCAGYGTSDKPNHDRVCAINNELQKLGYVTSFDEKRKSSLKQLFSRIENTKIVLVFVTDRYAQKVRDDDDYCSTELETAINNKKKSFIIPIIMQFNMADPSKWKGMITVISGAHAIKMHFDPDSKEFAEGIEELKQEIDSRLYELDVEIPTPFTPEIATSAPAQHIPDPAPVQDNPDPDTAKPTPNEPKDDEASPRLCDTRVELNISENTSGSMDDSNLYEGGSSGFNFNKQGSSSRKINRKILNKGGSPGSNNTPGRPGQINSKNARPHPGGSPSTGGNMNQPTTGDQPSSALSGPGKMSAAEQQGKSRTASPATCENTNIPSMRKTTSHPLERAEQEYITSKNDFSDEKTGYQPLLSDDNEQRTQPSSTASIPLHPQTEQRAQPNTSCCTKNVIILVCVLVILCLAAGTFCWMSIRLVDLQSSNSAMEKQIHNLTSTSGTWFLGLNLNPSDGHVMDYTTGWGDSSSIGTQEDALNKDYKSQSVWEMPGNYITIARHQHGTVDAVKVFRFTTGGLSLSQRFSNNNPTYYRSYVTNGGPIYKAVSPSAPHMRDDPIFSVGGDLVFNWGYGDNGVRVALTGGYLSAAGVDDDNTHGLGCNLICYPKTGVSGGAAYKHEISVIQDCAKLSACWYARNYRVIGTDHGSYYPYNSTAVYGYYAIYVSQNATTFPGPGTQLQLQVDV